MTVAAVLKEKGTDVITVAPSCTVKDIAGIIASRRLGAVVDHGALAGSISIRDAVKAHIQTQAHEVDSLKAYVYRGGG
jgi:CBS domain-containing protein